MAVFYFDSSYMKISFADTGHAQLKIQTKATLSI